MASVADLPSPGVYEYGEFIGAGVLPFCVTDTGKVQFFLGKELGKGRNKYWWSDFGGKRESQDETAEETACREFSEETLGLWGGLGPLCERVQNSAGVMREAVRRGGGGAGGVVQAPHRCFVLKNGLYVSFVVRVPYLDPLMFQIARDDNDESLPGAEPGSGTCRAAEKRDWTWVDAPALLSAVEGGQCWVLDQHGQRLHLLPRLAVTLRSFATLMLDHIACDSCETCRPLLRVPLDEEGRCLHLFDIRPSLASAGVKSALMIILGMTPPGDTSHGTLDKVTLYRDRNGRSNAFVLFGCNASAVSAKAKLLEVGGESLWDAGANSFPIENGACEEGSSAAHKSSGKEDGSHATHNSGKEDGANAAHTSRKEDGASSNAAHSSGKEAGSTATHSSGKEDSTSANAALNSGKEDGPTATHHPGKDAGEISANEAMVDGADTERGGGQLSTYELMGAESTYELMGGGGAACESRCADASGKEARPSTLPLEPRP